MLSGFSGGLLLVLTNPNVPVSHHSLKGRGIVESDTILIDYLQIWRVLNKNKARNKTFAEVIKSLEMPLYS